MVLERERAGEKVKGAHDSYMCERRPTVLTNLGKKEPDST